jgi:nitrogen-specific signal transduction histidine kinase/CheY-like chemotaxis protein
MAPDSRAEADQPATGVQNLEALGLLAGVVAHDINNLLVGILGNAGIALAALPSDSPIRATIEEIERAGQRAADLAMQMLAHAGRGTILHERIELNGLVEEMSWLVRSAKGGAPIKLELSDGLPPIEGDPTQIRQVVMNLLLNAADAVGARPGAVCARTGVSHETAATLATAHLGAQSREGTYAYVEVADSGRGIDPDTLERIFDPWFTTKATGRGLGLAAARGIIRDHGGALRVETAAGQGTTFRVLLPAVNESLPSNGAKPERTRPWQGTGAVLVVDDERTVRAVTARALETMGFATRQARGATEALRIVVEDDDIICVLLDLTMPGVNGAAAFEAIRESRPALPVVIMSGYGEQEVMSRFPGEGPAGFLQKPYEVGALGEAVRRAMCDGRT